MRHHEVHRSGRSGWLRAAVLGANDGLISTSSLVVGVAAAQAAREPVVIAALAGLVSGALSMAAGEYVSVSTQRDTERADLALERHELAVSPETERAELAAIYAERGLTPELAGQVADQLSAHDALAAHARDELGISHLTEARPIQAALASAGSFALGALAPVLLAISVPMTTLMPVVVVTAVAMLSVLGGTAARLGGASWRKGSLRVAFWGAAAMMVTDLVGRAFGSVVF
jgi:VIT1/CCC1 family predicted Fe2+/Mn2+ transporter